MKARSLLACACALAMPLWTAAGLAAPCPDQTPPGLHATLVTERVVVNGMAMKILQVQSKDAVAAVLDRVSAGWQQQGHAVRRGKAAGWDIVSALGERCLVSLQLVAKSGSFGYLSRSSGTAAVPSAASKGVTLPPDARIASSVASEDDGRKSLVLSLSSTRSLADLKQFFMRSLGEQAWQATRSHEVVNRKTGVKTLFLTAQKQRERVDIVIWPLRGSQIVMTISEAL